MRCLHYVFSCLQNKSHCHAVTGPGFPVGGADLLHGLFSVKTYVKIKELGLVGGGAPAVPNGSANAVEPILIPFCSVFIKYLDSTYEYLIFMLL